MRSENAEKDYSFGKVNLKTIINKTAVKNKDIILSNNISLNVHDIDTYVNTDAKWLEFIVNQIISNSIKYKKTSGEASENAILTSRVIDRPMRPLLPKDYRNDVTLNFLVLFFV